MSPSSTQDFQISPGSTPPPVLVDLVRLTRRRPDQISAHLSKPFWGLDYHVEEAGEYSLDGVTWQRRARYTAHLYAPGTRYWERCGAEDVPFSEMYFIFRAEDSAGLATRVAEGGGFAHFVDPSKTLLRMLTELPGIPSAPRVTWRAQGILLLVLDRLMSARRIAAGHYAIVPGPAAAAAAEGAETLAARVDRYLMAHGNGRVTLDEIAAEVGVSRSTLTHRYHAETGVSPIARLSERRLDLARSMILRGEPLKIVAAHTGFYDEYHLSKAFRRHFGLSPRRYAREATRDEGPMPRRSPCEAAPAASPGTRPPAATAQAGRAPTARPPG